LTQLTQTVLFKCAPINSITQSEQDILGAITSCSVVFAPIRFESVDKDPFKLDG